MDLTGEFEPTRKSILKNLSVISLGFLLAYSATSALSNIQSSLHSQQGLGVAALSVCYGALIVSCMFLPPLVIRYIGCKWGIPIPFVFSALYAASNAYATWYTLIPAAALTGVSAAVLWSAQGAYVTEISYQYSKLVNKPSEVVLVQFFGIFHVIHLTSQIWGNLASSLAFAPPSSSNTTTPWTNPEQLKICGNKYCNQELGKEQKWVDGKFETVSFGPNTRQVYILVGVCVIFIVVAILVTSIFLSPLKRRAKHQFSWKLLIATLQNLRNVKQILLIPITVYLGLNSAFIGSDFTQGFLTCSLGIQYVGYVMLCGGVVSVVTSLIIGTITKSLPRPPINVFAAIVQLSMCVTMLKWHPNPSMPAVYFVIAGLWSMSSAIWQTQINALYGILFPKNSEAGFSNSQLWLALGFIIGYAWHKYLCMTTKLYILIVMMTFSISCYLIVEFMLIMEKRRSKTTIK